MQNEYLYLILNLGSFSIPFLYSFHPKLQFYRLWKALFLSILITNFIFISWDILFTKYGVWGFNSDYHLSINFLMLPLEEWLFFICIPYACVFTHFALLHYFPKLKLNQKITAVISYSASVLFFIIAIYNYDKWYTLVNFSYGVLVILVMHRYQKTVLQQYFLTFIVMLIPFFIVNGILTGTGIENQVVWYNNEENLALRIATIPIEDILYAFTLIGTVLMLSTYFNKKFSGLID